MTETSFDLLFRDFVTDGVPGSGAQKPPKADVRDTLNGKVGQAISGREKVKTGAYTILSDDAGWTIIANSSGAITFTLPTVAAAVAAVPAGTNFQVRLFNIGTGTLTVDGNGSETVNGELTIQLSQYKGAVCWTDGTSWRADAGSSSGGLVVSGTINGDVASAAATLEIQNTPDVGFTFYRTGTANTVNECFIAGFAKDGGGTTIKTFSISEKFGQTGASDRYSILRLNATYAVAGVGTDYLGIRIFGGIGVTINGLSDTDDPDSATGGASNVETLIRGAAAVKGNLAVGKNNAGTSEEVAGVAFSTEGYHVSCMDGTGANIHAYFCNNAAVSTTIVGTIATTGSATAYNTSSDRRLKVDDGELSAADARKILGLITVHNFRWKETGLKDCGFFAQELHKIYPGAVTPGKGRPGRKGFQPWGVDQAKLMPVVLRCLQMVAAELDETKALQDEFEKRLAALESRAA